MDIYGCNVVQAVCVVVVEGCVLWLMSVAVLVAGELLVHVIYIRARGKLSQPSGEGGGCDIVQVSWQVCILHRGFSLLSGRRAVAVLNPVHALES